MDIEILTLRYSPNTGEFDNTPLRTLARDRELLGLREHFFVVGDQPHLLCVVTCCRHADSDRRERCEPNSDVARASQRSSASDLPEGLSDDQRQLFDQIRRWRAAEAERGGVPRYVVLTNRDVEALVRTRPDSEVASRLACTASAYEPSQRRPCSRRHAMDCPSSVSICFELSAGFDQRTADGSFGAGITGCGSGVGDSSTSERSLTVHGP